jgi:hypothetical protein
MPGFTTHLMDVEVEGDKATVLAYVDWFLEDIQITAHCTFTVSPTTKTKKVDGVDRIVHKKEIKFDAISASCRWTLGEAITMSIKKKVENGLNPV